MLNRVDAPLPGSKTAGLTATIGAVENDSGQPDFDAFPLGFREMLRVASQPPPALREAIRVASQPPPALREAIRVASQPPPALRDAARLAAQPPPALREAARLAAQPPAGLQEVARLASQPPVGLQDAIRLATQPSPAIREALKLAMQPNPAIQAVIDTLEARGLRDVLDRLPADYSLRRLADATHTIVAEYDLGLEYEEPFRRVAEQAPDSDAEPELKRSLATLPWYVQVALLIQALHVVDSAGRFMADLAHLDVPRPVRSSTDLLFAVIVFLLLWVEQSGQPPDD
jgi:hypothetical protein